MKDYSVEEIVKIGKEGYTLENSRKKAVVLIHGFSGSPADLIPARDALFEAGYTVISYPLKGHTTKPEDLVGTHYKDWYASAEKVFLAAQSKYEDVYLVAHSMGGCISALLASKYKVKAMALYEPAFSFTNRSMYFSYFLKHSKKTVTWSADSYPDGNEKFFAGSSGSFYCCTLNDLRILSRKSRQCEKKIQTPSLLFWSVDDPVVSLSGMEQYMKKVPSLKKELVILQKGAGGHNIQFGRDRKEVFSKTLEFFKSAE
jgi:carboxylesterase